MGSYLWKSKIHLILKSALEEIWCSYVPDRNESRRAHAINIRCYTTELENVGEHQKGRFSLNSPSWAHS